VVGIILVSATTALLLLALLILAVYEIGKRWRR
jgi:hypothetical protein